MIRPLVDDPKLAGIRREVRDRILRQHGHAGSIDKIGNAVVDFGIDMVRMPGEDDPHLAAARKLLKDFLAFALDIVLEAPLLPERLGQGFVQLVFRDAAE